jgi:hypothetical protein
MVATMISSGLSSKMMGNAGAGKIQTSGAKQTSHMAALQAVNF